LWCRVGLPLIVAASPNAVVLLGDVRQGQEVRERARYRQRVVERQILEHLVEGLEVVRVALARPLGQGSHSLDHLEEMVALLCPKRFAEEVAQQVDVVAEWLVRIRAHVI
jgi:hypothetical protein